MSAVLSFGGSVGAKDFLLTAYPGSQRPHDTSPTPTNYLYETSFQALPKQPKLPRAGLNELVWPVTGVSNYAVCRVLVPEDVAAAITAGTVVGLKLTDTRDEEVDGEPESPRSFDLYAYDRRPLVDTHEDEHHADPDATPEAPCDGWVLTLVDERFLRRGLSASDSPVASTWGALVWYYLGQAGFGFIPAISEIDDMVPPGLPAPDPSYWVSFPGESYAVLADAAALAAGLRLVVKGTGQIVVQNAEEADLERIAWLGETGRDEFTSGGQTKGDWAAPEFVALLNTAGVATSFGTGYERLGDTEPFVYPANDVSGCAPWVEEYARWLAVPRIEGDVRGFPSLPATGVVEHCVYEIAAGSTRIVSHPARYPLPTLRNGEAQVKSDGSIPVPTGSGASYDKGRFVGYVYDFFCVGGKLQKWRAADYWSSKYGPTRTAYSYLYDDGCCECGGSGSGSGSAPASNYFNLSGCSYDYPKTIYGTWTGYTGGCACFTGSFPLVWNGVDRWIGTFVGCASTVTVELAIDNPAAPTQWTRTFSSGSYTFSPSPATSSFVCGALPGGGIITVTGACIGGGTFFFSA